MEQDTISTLFGDIDFAALIGDSLAVPARAWRGYTSVDTLRPGECYIMPFPEDSTAQTGYGADLETAMRHVYFAGRDSLLPELLPYHSEGVVGTPVPYTVRTDNALTILLLLCFVVFIVSLAHSKHFLLKQLKDFFWPSATSTEGGSGGELRFMAFLSIVHALVLAISTYMVTTDLSWSTDVSPASFTAIADGKSSLTGVALIGLLFAAFTAYFCLKWTVGTMVNTTFFGVKKNLQWMTLQLQVSALSGVSLFPMLALQIYFDYATENALLYIGIVLFLNKILTFYKSFQIFFHGNGLYMQTFLYFCTLEIVPLLTFCGAGLAILDLVKVNF